MKTENAFIFGTVRLALFKNGKRSKILKRYGSRSAKLTENAFNFWCGAVRAFHKKTENGTLFGTEMPFFNLKIMDKNFKKTLRYGAVYYGTVWYGMVRTRCKIRTLLMVLNYK
jgi:hypothetical protein